MSLNADALQFLMERGMSIEDVVGFARLMEADKPKVDEAAERRRAADRERKARQRDSLRNVCGMSADDGPAPAFPPNPPITPTPGKSNSRTRKGGFQIPNWVPAEPWAAFVEMRRETGHKMTERAMRLAVAELEKLRDEGSDPAAVLNQSTMKSWRGLFGVKQQPGTPQQPADPSKWTLERRAAYARAMDSPDDPASRVRRVRGVGEIIQGIGR